MNILRQTVSLCTTCYREIPATISIEDNGVFMHKTCADHGEQMGMVERDPLFYMLVASLRSPSIYDGYFVDVTRQCNLRCSFCYYPLETKDPAGEFTIEKIVSECRVNAHHAPFILTGGEPTLRPDIVELIKAVQEVGPVELLTNGVRLADPALFGAVAELLTDDKGRASINLSIHPETDKWQAVIDLCRKHSIKIESALIVVDSYQSFLKAIELARSMNDVVLSFRIKAATRIWNERKPPTSTQDFEDGDEHVFVSDMIEWLEMTGKPLHLVTNGRHTKSVFANYVYDGMFLMLLSWHDVTNVDLLDIDCPPYYRARNGEVANFVTTALINEGLAAGWLKGQRTEQILFNPDKHNFANTKEYRKILEEVAG